jgi:putative ABC transport system ATP-binding protein
MVLLHEKEEVTTPMDNKPVMVFKDVVKVYSLPSGDVTALEGVSFQVDRGEFISVMGPSGSGKSTLLNLMGCLDTPTSGDIYISGTRTGDMSDKELTNCGGTGSVYISVFRLSSLLNIIGTSFPMVLKCQETWAGKSVLCQSGSVDDSLFTHTPWKFRRSATTGCRKHS